MSADVFINLRFFSTGSCLLEKSSLVDEGINTLTICTWLVVCMGALFLCLLQKQAIDMSG